MQLLIMSSCQFFLTKQKITKSNNPRPLRRHSQIIMYQKVFHKSLWAILKISPLSYINIVYYHFITKYNKFQHNQDNLMKEQFKYKIPLIKNYNTYSFRSWIVATKELVLFRRHKKFSCLLHEKIEEVIINIVIRGFAAKQKMSTQSVSE